MTAEVSQYHLIYEFQIQTLDFPDEIQALIILEQQLNLFIKKIVGQFIFVIKMCEIIEFLQEFCCIFALIRFTFEFLVVHKCFDYIRWNIIACFFVELVHLSSQ